MITAYHAGAICIAIGVVWSIAWAYRTLASLMHVGGDV